MHNAELKPGKLIGDDVEVIPTVALCMIAGNEEESDKAHIIEGF
jgi:hypothetical protein